MATQVRVGGAWQSLIGTKVFAGGGWRTISKIQTYVSGSWEIVADFGSPSSPPGPLTATITPNPFSTQSRPFINTSISAVMAAASGGRAPFSYSYSVVSSSPTTITFGSPTTSATSIVADTHAGSVSCTIECTVTDSLGSTAIATATGTLS